MKSEEQKRKIFLWALVILYGLVILGMISTFLSGNTFVPQQGDNSWRFIGNVFAGLVAGFSVAYTAVAFFLRKNLKITFRECWRFVYLNFFIFFGAIFGVGSLISALAIIYGGKSKGIETDIELTQTDVVLQMGLLFVIGFAFFFFARFLNKKIRLLKQEIIKRG
jgi:hypothetical protein